MAKERKVGEKFVIGGILYECRLAENGCLGCTCLIKEENHCTDVNLREFGGCTSIFRSDANDVIFVELSWQCPHCEHFVMGDCSGEMNSCEDYITMEVYPEYFDNK